MASKTGISKALEFLAQTLHGEVTPALVVLWRTAFEEVSDQDLLEAVIAYAQQERFFPAPADILSILGEAPPRPGEAWAKAVGALYGDVHPSDLPDAIRDTLRAMGGVRFVREQMRFSEARAVFMSIYKNLSAAASTTRARERARQLAPTLISSLLPGPGRDDPTPKVDTT